MASTWSYYAKESFKMRGGCFQKKSDTCSIVINLQIHLKKWDELFNSKTKYLR